MSLTEKAKQQGKRLRKRKTEIEIRQMTLEDLSDVWHLGEEIFTPSRLQYTYRTWNVDELVNFLWRSRTMLGG